MGNIVNVNNTIQLTPATPQQLESMQQWFTTREQCQQWGGPAFRFPVTEKSFTEDCRFAQLPSYALVNADNALLAFGQFYPRLNHCHLGRLAVNPQHRQRGYAITLIAALSDCGSGQLGLRECSLFVLANNPAAILLYRKLGFTPVDYPADDIALDNFLYMTVPSQHLQQWRHSHPCMIQQSSAF